MSSEQLSRRDNTKTEREIQVKKETVPQLTSHFEAIAVHGKPTEERQQQHVSIAKGTLPGREEEEERRRIAAAASGKPDDTHELAVQFESLADRVSGKIETDKERTAAAREREQKHKVGSEQAEGKEGEVRASRQNQPSLEDVSNYRAKAQEQSNQAIMAAKERCDKANKESQEKTNKAIRMANERCDRENKESLNQGGGLGARTDETKQRGKDEAEGTFEGRGGQQQTGLGTVKETLTTAAIMAKDYTAPIAEKAKDYTVSAGQTTAHYLGEKAVAAKDAALESGKVAAEYAGKAAEDLKEKAVVAGWSTAHYSCDTAVEGTKAVARLVKGAAGYAGDIAVKPLASAKNVAESTGKSVKEYTARKKEEAQRESTYKQSEKESMYEKTKETFEGAKETVKERGEGEVEEGRGDDGGIFGAIGETIYEIAQTTKEIVIGPGDESGKQKKTLGFELGQDQEEEEEKGQGYEKDYQTATRSQKEHRA